MKSTVFIHENFIHQNIVHVNIDIIRYIIAAGQHCKIRVVKGWLKLVVTLDELEAALPPDRFIRVNDKTIVSLKRVIAHSEQLVCLTYTCFPVTEKYSDELDKRRSYRHRK